MADNGGSPDDLVDRAESLIDNSSFGTPGARRLSARTPAKVASDIVSNIRHDPHAATASSSAGARGTKSASAPRTRRVESSTDSAADVVVVVSDGDDPVAARASRSRLAREELARELRRLRTDARRTGTAMARATGMSQSKLSKIENGMLLPSVTDVERLTAELSATWEVRSRLVDLARQLYAEAEARRVVLHRGAQRHQQTVARIEARATTSRFFQNAGVPALLQSENYLRVVLNTTPPHERDTAVATLHARRAQMDDPDKQFVFLLAESALRWRIGPADLMCEQIDHLLTIAKKPNVKLGVVPWTADANLVALHGFQVYDERVVTLSVLTGNATITDPHDVREYLALFGRLERLAVRGEALEDLLEHISMDHRKLG